MDVSHNIRTLRNIKHAVNRAHQSGTVNVSVAIDEFYKDGNYSNWMNMFKTAYSGDIFNRDPRDNFWTQTGNMYPSHDDFYIRAKHFIAKYR